MPRYLDYPVDYDDGVVASAPCIFDGWAAGARHQRECIDIVLGLFAFFRWVLELATITQAKHVARCDECHPAKHNICLPCAKRLDDMYLVAFARSELAKREKARLDLAK